MITSHDIFWVFTVGIFLVAQIPGKVKSEADDHLNDPDTVSVTSLPNKDQILKVLETSFLNIFGQERRPKTNKKFVVPNYMIDLYKKQINDMYTEDPSVMAKGKGLSTANTARSFYHADVESSPDCIAPFCHRLWFDLNTIPKHETLRDSELRIFNDINEFIDSTQEISATNNSKNDYKKFKVEIYEIMQPHTTERFSISRLIDTKVLNNKKSSWQTFDVHPAVLKWKSSPRKNHGVEIRIVPCNSSLDSSQSPVARHLRVARSVNSEKNEWNSKRPILVTYTDDGRGPVSRRKRETKKERRRKRRRNKKRGKKLECMRHALYVDFQDVQWNDWIVAPQGYQAFYCQGECNFPLADHLNSTNHAIVQTLVNSVDPRAVPKPCCVPTELSPISMLYLDEYETVVLKNYQDMVVEGCGCR